MKSFRLETTESKRELIHVAIALLVSVGLFWAFRNNPQIETRFRAMGLFAGAIYFGYLCRGRLGRTLRQQYPNARAIGLLSVGFTILTFGVIARFIVPGATEGTFTMAFLLPAGAFIAAFVMINRKDPDVMR